MTLLELVILSAASWYISYSLTSTSGPFAIFERLQAFKGGRWHGRGQAYTLTTWNPQTLKADIVREIPGRDGLLDCITCLIFWVAQLLVLATGHTVLEGLAAAGVGLWIHGYTGWRHKIN